MPSRSMRRTNQLQKGYGMVPDHWREIASVVSLSDFKSRFSTALSGLSTRSRSRRTSLTAKFR